MTIQIYESNDHVKPCVCINTGKGHIMVPQDRLEYVIHELTEIHRRNDTSLKDHLPPFSLSPMFGDGGWRLHRYPTWQEQMDTELRAVFNSMCC
jgi:hypothetical protein